MNEAIELIDRLYGLKLCLLDLKFEIMKGIINGTPPEEILENLLTKIETKIKEDE